MWNLASIECVHNFNQWFQLCDSMPYAARLDGRKKQTEKCD